MKFLDTCLTYDDVSLVPVCSEVQSRTQPRTDTFLGAEFFSIPIISAAMNTITEQEMCEAMIRTGAGAVLHRYMSIEDQVHHIVRIQNGEVTRGRLPFVAVGISGDYLERAKELAGNCVRAFCVDAANGHSKVCVDAVKALRKMLPDVDIMAGNVCTGEGALNLVHAGANIVKVGIGCGSVCETRLVTGFGVPQFSAVRACRAAVPSNVQIVADGGLKNSGDIVKALAIGAAAVMTGGLLAGVCECPNGTFRGIEDGVHYAEYSGMASTASRSKWWSCDSNVTEGTSFKVPCRSGVSARDVVLDLVAGVKVGMSFANALTLKQLQRNASFVRVTSNGSKETNPRTKMFGNVELHAIESK